MKKIYVFLLMCFLMLVASQAACAFQAGKAESPTKAAPTTEAPPLASISQGSAPDNADNQSEDACALSLPDIVASEFITEVILAKSVEAPLMKPVEPTSEFGAKDVFNAVVALEKAPVGTRFKASWYVQDVGKAAKCNTIIDEHEVTTDGTRNLDFNLSPIGTWPAGSYRVEIFVNDVLSSVQVFSVR